MGEIKYVHMTRARADDDPHADTGVTALYFIGTVPRTPLRATTRAGTRRGSSRVLSVKVRSAPLTLVLDSPSAPCTVPSKYTPLLRSN